jgi:predicted transcriptional regulator
MTKKAFDQIMEGLHEALAVARGENTGAKLHVPAELKVGIASYEEMKARTMAIARGERRVRPGEPKVWVTESFAKVLSGALNRHVAEGGVASKSVIRRLAAQTGQPMPDLSDWDPETKD